MAIYSIVLLMMGEIVTRNMYSKANANKKRNCCILLDLFHHYKSYNCSILRGPGGERIVNIAPGATEIELKLRRGIG